MTLKFSNPMDTNELKRFNIKPQYARLLYTIPIDLRFIRIENILRAHAIEQDQFDPVLESNFNPLWVSMFMMRDYLRNKIIELCDNIMLPLYLNTNKSKGWVLCNYPKGNTEEEISYKYLDTLDKEQRDTIVKLLIDIHSSFIEPYADILVNQVPVFKFQDYTIDLYTLGEIATYRYLEERIDIIKTPRYYRMEDNKLYIDF